MRWRVFYVCFPCRRFRKCIDSKIVSFFPYRWVHIVCALYVPGVAFGDIDKLRPVTLTEMNYSKYGAKVRQSVFGCLKRKFLLINLHDFLLILLTTEMLVSNYAIHIAVSTELFIIDINFLRKPSMYKFFHIF